MKKLLVVLLPLIFFLVSCSKDDVEPQKNQVDSVENDALEALTSNVREKQFEEWTRDRESVLAYAKEEYGYTAAGLADECNCFYRIVKSNGFNASFPDAAFEISSNSSCGTVFPPTCRYLQAYQTTVSATEQDCYSEIVQGCTDFYYDGLGSENWADFNCDIDEGETFRVTAFGLAFDQTCNADWLEYGKITLQIGCVNSNNSTCPDSDFIHYSTPFTLTPDKITGSPSGTDGYDYQDIFTDCGCNPQSVN